MQARAEGGGVLGPVAFVASRYVGEWDLWQRP